MKTGRGRLPHLSSSETNYGEFGEFCPFLIKMGFVFPSHEMIFHRDPPGLHLEQEKRG